LPLLQLITGGVREQPFRCQPLQYWETVSLHLPDGINLSRKQAPVAYRAGFDGETAYGTVHGRIEVDGEVVLDGRTVSSQAHVQVSFDKRYARRTSSTPSRGALSRFNEFRRADIGLTPKPVAMSSKSARPTISVSGLRQRKLRTCLDLAQAARRAGQRRCAIHPEPCTSTARRALDHQEAARWFLLAAAQGDAFGQTSLATSTKGLGVPRDDKRAVEWFAKAAELGDQQAQSAPCHDVPGRPRRRPGLQAGLNGMRSRPIRARPGPR